MQLLRRLFGMDTETAPAFDTFTIHFNDGKSARAVHLPQRASAKAAAEALQLPHPCPTLVIMGGAAAMNPENIRTTRSSIEDGLSRFAEEHNVVIVDGGTTAGVMGLLGFSRQRRHYHFPLVGVAPDARVAYPGHNPPTRLGDLDPNHSHFALVEGEDFGAESDLLAELGWAIADAGKKTILGVIINGGEIVKQEAHARATGSLRFPLLVLDGSGRFADELAAAYRAGTSSDPVLHDILTKGTVHVLPANTSADNLRNWLENFFGM
jgi:hypothetical protein